MSITTKEYYIHMALPRSISNIVKDVTKSSFGNKDLLFGKMVAEWVHIVGEEVAHKTVPLDLKYQRGNKKKNQAVLHLGVKSSYALEFSYKKTLVIERLNMFFGYAAIKDIKIIQQSGFMDKQKKVKKPSREITAKESDNLDKKLDKIGENDLQIALRKLGKAILLQEDSKRS